MKKPSFALYAAGVFFFEAVSVVCIVIGFRFNIPALFFCSGFAASYGSRIIDYYFESLRAYSKFEYDKLKAQQVSSVCHFLASRRSIDG